MSVDARSELYQQMILEHNRNPRHFGKLSDATHVAEGYNPLCGDHFNVYLRINQEDVIEEAYFDGSGCAISKASASLMTDAVKGKKVDEAKALFESFQELVTQKTTEDRMEDLGKLSVFSGIWQYPSRVKCAVLSWHAMKGACDNTKSVSTEKEE